MGTACLGMHAYDSLAIVHTAGKWTFLHKTKEDSATRSQSS